MARASFHASLDNVQALLLRLGGAAESAIYRAVESLETQNLQNAQAVIDGDDELDELENEVEEQVMRLLALQQPLARDLRTLSTIWKTATDLERVGDYAVNIAERVLWIGTVPLIKPLVDIPRMARMAEQMLRESLDSFVRRDIELAAKVCADDDAVDDIYADLFDELIGMVTSGDKGTATQAVQLLFVARYLERVADHATNLAERVVYMVTGRRVAHQGNMLSDSAPEELEQQELEQQEEDS